MSLLAIDIGSSACKAVAASVDGKVLSRHCYSYSPDSPQPSYAEMDPKRFWEAVCVCSRESAKHLTDPVQAVCLSSHGESFVAVDARNEPVYAALLNQDNRAVAEADWLEQRFGRKRLFEITGLIAHPMYPIPKILWLRKHRPEIFSSHTRFVSITGYVLLQLGLEPYIDFSLASRYLAFDVRKHRWHDEILDSAALSSGELPIPVPAGTIAGQLSSESAAQLGLATGTRVVVGGHDQPCGALGLGVESGRIADSMGTYECLLATSDTPVLTEAALANALNSYCHVIPDKYATIAFFPSGIMMEWFLDLLHDCAPRHAGDKQSATERYALLEASVPSGPTGLCITPHLIGTCNPDFNPRARGSIFGLTTDTSRAHVYKGILEGLACEFSAMTKLLSSAIGDFQDIHVTGGGTRSALGLRLRSAIAEKRLHVMQPPDAVCVGGAILAGVAVGTYSSIREAVDQVVREVSVIDPDPAMSAAYTEQVTQYQRFRSALAPLQSS